MVATIITLIFYPAIEINVCRKGQSHNKDGTRSAQMTMGKKAVIWTQINMVPLVVPSIKNHKTDAERDQGRELPVAEVAIVKSSEQSLTSSIGIGEFGMNTSKKWQKTLAMARGNLFQMVKISSRTNTSLDHSMEPTSICGLMKLHCNISDADASQWWEQKSSMVKGIHTDCWNNKIKMIKQVFTGQYIHA